MRRFRGMLGGPVGRHTVPGRTGGSFFTPMRVLILLTTLSAVVAVLLKSPCRLNGWGQPGRLLRRLLLRLGRALWRARFRGGSLRPVRGRCQLRVSRADVRGRLDRRGDLRDAAALRELNPTLAYWDVNFVFTAVLWIVTVVVTAKSAGRRPWDALMVAVAPGIILAGSINWDLWAVALLAVGMWLFGGRRPLLAGIFFGLGAAMKLYPLLVLGALLILARALAEVGPVPLGRAGHGGGLAGGQPADDDRQRRRLERVLHLLRRTRPGTVLDLARLGRGHGPDRRTPPSTPGSLSLLAYGAFFLCLRGDLRPRGQCRHRPRVAQLTFLIVAAFVLCNKVYSPQFVMWLVPLAALARARAGGTS